jgi:hypothetical protein
VQKIHEKFCYLPVKINAKVRQKARPFHCCKLLNLIFSFLEENLNRILMKIQFLKLKGVFNCYNFKQMAKK